VKTMMVSVHRQDENGKPLGRQEVDGYICEIDGILLCVHRSLEHRGPGLAAKLSADHWTVTEPKTGRAIWDGSVAFDAPDKRYPRSYAIHRAECVIAENGGARAVSGLIDEKYGGGQHGSR
jgi:hypothetical protein